MKPPTPVPVGFLRLLAGVNKALPALAESTDPVARTAGRELAASRDQAQRLQALQDNPEAGNRPVEEQDPTELRHQPLMLKSIRERLVEGLAALDRLPKWDPAQPRVCYIGYPRDDVAAPPEVVEMRRKNYQTELAGLDARIVQVTAIVEAHLAAKLAAKEHIFHAPGPRQGYTYCQLEIRALQEPDRCFSWASDGVDTWNSEELTCSICKRGDIQGRAAGWRGPLPPKTPREMSGEELMRLRDLIVTELAEIKRLPEGSTWGPEKWRIGMGKMPPLPYPIDARRQDLQRMLADVDSRMVRAKPKRE